MNIRPKLTPAQQMTIKEFLAFTATRPDGERWELIEGAAVLNPSPVQVHQVVVANVVSFLMKHKQEANATWTPMPGVGTRVRASPNNLPQPDVYVQAGAVADSAETDDALVIFEVLSRSNTKADQAWRRRFYSSVPNCAHYVTISLKALEVTLFNRAAHWAPLVLDKIGDDLRLDAIGVAMPLAEIYRWSRFAEVRATKRKRRS